MGEGDFIPTGGHRRKRMSKKQIAEMIRLGKEARRIERETRAKHEREEVPKAEEELLEALKDIETNKIKTAKK